MPYDGGKRVKSVVGLGVLNYTQNRGWTWSISTIECCRVCYWCFSLYGVDTFFVTVVIPDFDFRGSMKVAAKHTG